MKIRRRGMLLLLVLLLVSTMFVLAAGFLSTRTRERATVTQSRDSYQAHELAYAGLETVRVRLQNDFNFPPSTLGPLQEVFKFSEVVMSYDGSKTLGRYQIYCDRRWVDGPYEILRVTSVGQVGDEDGNPVRHKLIGEFSMKVGERGDMVNLIDLGAF
jgi:hypothetical protein